MVDTTLFHKAMIGRGWTMRLKPKSTVQNQKALVYRRFTQLEDSYTANVLYHTEDGKFWSFNASTMSFKVIDIMRTDKSTIIEVADSGTILEYNNTQFLYVNNTWVNTTGQGTNAVQLPNQPVLYEPQSGTYWAIKVASDNTITSKRLTTPPENSTIVEIEKFPAMYYLAAGNFAVFLGDLKIVRMKELHPGYTETIQTQDGKYWECVNGQMQETDSPSSRVILVPNYYILFYGDAEVEQAEANIPMMYYNGTLWVYAISNSYSEEGIDFKFAYDRYTFSKNTLFSYYSKGLRYWFYDNTLLTNQMVELDLDPTSMAIIGTNIKVINTSTIYVGENHTYKFQDDEFVIADGTILPNSEFLSAKFGNIARYQTNKYYFVGSFDYMIRGSIEGTTTQHIKGNIMPLTSMNIKYFNDDIDLDVDDLVVIGDHLFSVENPETTQKRMPKAFKVHFATLNSIL